MATSETQGCLSPPRSHQQLSGASALSPTRSPLKQQKGRGAFMAAAAAEQKGIIEAGGQVSEQFANWRSVESRVRAGGKLATLALQLQDACGTPSHSDMVSRRSCTPARKRKAAEANMGSPLTGREAGKAKSAAIRAINKGTGRALPAKYAQLETLFRTLEGVCSLLQTRKKACTFENVKKPLEDTTGRRFLLSHLAQLVAVFPEAFALQYVSARRGSASTAGLGLLVGPQTPPGNKWELRIELQPLPNAADSAADAEQGSPAGRPVPASQEREHSRWRLQGFRERLWRAAEGHHRRFLEDRGWPDHPAWHPAFDLNNVPDIPCAPLPSPPGSASSTSPLLRRPPRTPPAPVAHSELAQDPAGSPLSPGHAGSPFRPLDQRIPRAGPATPTKRSLTATFDQVFDPFPRAAGNAEERGLVSRSDGVPREGLSSHGCWSEVEAGAAELPGGTVSHPHCIDSTEGTGREEQSVSSSAGDSDCVVVSSAPAGGGQAEAGRGSRTVVLSEGGEPARGGLQGVPLDILQQVASKQQRLAAENSAAAVEGRRRRGMLQQLPALVNLLRSVAESEGRIVLREEHLLERLLSTHPRLTDKGEVAAQLRLLQAVAPDVLSTSTISSGTLLRINMRTDFAALKKRLGTAI